MRLEILTQEVAEGLDSFEWMDPHTHLDAAHLTARGLDDILLYHMAVSDLYAAGCPSGSRVDEDRKPAEARRRVLESLPYLDSVRNTSISWGIRTILADLYEWREPVTADNWERLDRAIAERGRDPGWGREIFRRARIARVGTELWRGRSGGADDLFQYALEWAFFARSQWGQPDISVYELERAWNDEAPTPPVPVTFDRESAPVLARQIHTVGDVREAVVHYCAKIPYGRVLATAQHVSTDIDYTQPADEDMSCALKRRSEAGQRERDVYASYILNLFLAELERREAGIVFQFSLGAEPLPYESGARLSQRTIGQVGEIIARFPRLRFQCFLASRHANQSLCTLARELPNLSLAGYWWHNFFPGAIRQVIEERLDMLPVNRQIAFLSDAYTAEWTYGKKAIVRKLLAEVLAGRIALGQYTLDEALGIGRSILYESAVELLGMQPKPSGGPAV